jgi:hypothetical protein
MKKILLFFPYIFLLFSLKVAYGQAFESNLPILKITTSSAILNEPKVNGFIEIIDNKGKLNKSTDLSTFKYNIGIEYRGSTSQDLSPKKPFGIETRTEKGENLNVSLLGLPAENDWVIISPYSDKSLIRDHLSYEIARAMNRYANRTKFIELIVNGEYYGVCVLGEKIKQGKDRVNISKLKDTDISGDDLTGGYILKLDKTTGSKASNWTSAYNSPLRPHLFQIDYPKIEDIKPEQFNYIKKFINNFETTLQSADFRDPEKGYPKIIDTDSFVDYFLVNEITKNVDAYRLSTFFYKDKDSKNSKLIMGPAWDFNLAFGNANYCEGWLHNGWAYRFNDVCPNDPVGGVPFWWSRLLLDENFQLKLKSRWKGLRSTTLTDTNIFSKIDSSTTLLKDAQVRNFAKWQILGKYVWPNNFIAKTYIEEITHTKQWLKDRLNWMDNSALLNSNLLPTEALLVDIEKPNIFPNPIVNRANITFGISKNEFVKGQIIDNKGRKISTIISQELNIGEYKFEFERGNLPAGIYYFSLEKNNKPAYFQKIILI